MELKVVIVFLALVIAKNESSRTPIEITMEKLNEEPRTHFQSSHQLIKTLVFIMKSIVSVGCDDLNSFMTGEY